MSSNKVRIIAGQWRGRKIAFPDAAGLRPTADRNRETLFNWLQQGLQGAHCLDCFAGSGALAFEALSRGAASATLVEKAAPIVAALQNSQSLLQANAKIIQQDICHYLKTRPAKAYDLIFIDPPFQQGFVQKLYQLLRENPLWLKANTKIYIEHEKTLSLDCLQQWQCLHEKSAGACIYGLWQPLL